VPHSIDMYGGDVVLPNGTTDRPEYLDIFNAV
jgi:hypothetical protein